MTYLLVWVRENGGSETCLGTYPETAYDGLREFYGFRRVMETGEAVVLEFRAEAIKADPGTLVEVRCAPREVAPHWPRMSFRREAQIFLGGVGFILSTTSAFFQLQYHHGWWAIANAGCAALNLYFLRRAVRG